ncbi:hypothetical protein [Dyella japonica]|uniref:Uncharacterized protein n=1 Tax=Dyella japonica A8 TaxID=1217721 RepID=A0A075JWL8_9GAMM|nr:hypothetical protein [Dyella japonica]AIF46279.1 hypothetical protein HY57_02930 [Dyella japonica A8]
MLGRRLLPFALLLAAVSGPVLAAKTPAKAPTADTQQTARRQALLQYQKDLVSVSAPQADPIPLMGAALLARPLPDQPDFNSYHNLIGRAAEAQGAGPEISWARLSDCDAKASDCPNADALAKLVQQAPDNAAVWLLKLGQDIRDGKNDDARQDLAKAASAKVYDDYTGATLKALSGAVTLLPPPTNVVGPLSAMNGADVQLTLVFGLAEGQPQPALQATSRLCEDNADKPSVKADCLKLGKLLEWGSSPLSRSLGLHLREVLDEDTSQQEDAKRLRRNLVWQVQSFSQLSLRAKNDTAVAQHLLKLARSGGTQMSLVLTALHDYNMPVDAPSDWEPTKAG